MAWTHPLGSGYLRSILQDHLGVCIQGKYTGSGGGGTQLTSVKFVVLDCAHQTKGVPRKTDCPNCCWTYKSIDLIKEDSQLGNAKSQVQQGENKINFHCMYTLFQNAVSNQGLLTRRMQDGERSNLCQFLVTFSDPYVHVGCDYIITNEDIVKCGFQTINIVTCE